MSRPCDTAWSEVFFWQMLVVDAYCHDWKSWLENASPGFGLVESSPILELGLLREWID